MIFRSHFSSSRSSPNGLTLSHQLLYSFPLFVVMAMAMATSVVQGIYAKYFGLTMTTIATVLVVARLFDLITDPLVGYLSDRYHHRHGTRKPFLVVGGLVFAVSAYLLAVPVAPDAVTESTQVSGIYFAVCYLLLYLGLTLFLIPHQAWGSELAASGDEKSSIFTFLAAAGLLGAAVFYAAPMLPWARGTAITPQSLQWSALICLALIVPALFVSLTRVPDTLSESAEARATDSVELRVLLQMILRNKPLQLYGVAFFFFCLAINTVMSMEFIYIDAYLGMGDDYALASLIAMLLGVASMRGWYWLSVNRGKKTAWALGGGVTLLSLLGFMTLKPGEASFAHLLMVQALLVIGTVSWNVVPLALLSELVDYSRWKYGLDSTGQLFSLNGLLVKLSLALAGGAGFYIAGHFGFEASAATQSPLAVRGLHLVIVGIPLICLLISVWLMNRLRFESRHHEIVRRRIAAGHRCGSAQHDYGSRGMASGQP